MSRAICAALVRGIGVAVQEDDDQGFDALAEQAARRGLDLRLVQRGHNRPVGAGALVDLQAQGPGNQRRHLERHAVRLGARAPAELEDIAEAARRDQAACRVLALEHGVGRDRGAVNDRAHVVRRMRDAGVLVAAGLPLANFGRDGDHIQISPPFTISAVEIDLLVDALDDALGAVAREVGRLDA